MTATPPSPKPSRRGGTYLVLAAIMLVGAAAAWFLTPTVRKMMDTKATPTAEVVDSTPGKPIVLENLVANPAGSEGMRYLIATVSIEAVTATDEEALRARDARVKDLVLGVVGLYSSEWLAGTAQRDSLKGILGDTLRTTFKLSAKPAIYFPQYVLQ